jgi:hypothetical protein
MQPDDFSGVVINSRKSLMTGCCEEKKQKKFFFHLKCIYLSNFKEK